MRMLMCRRGGVQHCDRGASTTIRLACGGGGRGGGGGRCAAAERRRRWRGPLWSGGGSGGPSVALPAREHTHTHNISSCAFAMSGWVRAVAHLGSRRRSTHTNSPRPSLRGTWARPAMSEDAALEDGAARARSFAMRHHPRRLLQHASNAHRAARPHARGARRFHKAAHSTCSKLEENGCCTTVGSPQMNRCVAQLPHGGDRQRVAHAQLFHVDV